MRKRQRKKNRKKYEAESLKKYPWLKSLSVVRSWFGEQQIKLNG